MAFQSQEWNSNRTSNQDDLPNRQMGTYYAEKIACFRYAYVTAPAQNSLNKEVTCQTIILSILCADSRLTPRSVIRSQDGTQDC